jgi:hypothetical protein
MRADYPPASCHSVGNMALWGPNRGRFLPRWRRAKAVRPSLVAVPCGCPLWLSPVICRAARASGKGQHGGSPASCRHIAKLSLLYAFAGFVIPLHVLGLRAVGLGLRRFFGLRQHRSCKRYGESQSDSRQEYLHRLLPGWAPAGRAFLAFQLAAKYGEP